jgi:hypothetical protein
VISKFFFKFSTRGSGTPKSRNDLMGAVGCCAFFKNESSFNSTGCCATETNYNNEVSILSHSIFFCINFKYEVQYKSSLKNKRKEK